VSTLACDPPTDGPTYSLAVDVTSLGYRTDLALLAAGGAQITDRGDHLVVRSPDNPTYWWGNFVLVQAPRDRWDADHWLQVFAAEFPDARHLALGVDDPTATAQDLAALTQRGLRVEQAVVMTATAVHEPARPHRKATYRTLSTDEDWVQHVALRMTCHEGDIDPDNYREFVTSRAQTNRAVVDGGGGNWFGAFVDGRLVSQLGLLNAGQGLARFQSVETDPAFRGRGLAGSLVHHASRYGFESLAAHTLVMVADPEYLAIRIYRSVGFRDTENQLQADRAPAPTP